MKKALARVTDGTDYVHVSFDLDAVDPTVAPGVGTPVKGGLDYREAHLIMELLHDSGMMTSLELVEVNPILDDRNASGLFAVYSSAALLQWKLGDLARADAAAHVALRVAQEGDFARGLARLAFSASIRSMTCAFGSSVIAFVISSPSIFFWMSERMRSCTSSR